MQLQEAKRACSKLSYLLSQPMVKQWFGKFLSTIQVAGTAGVPPSVMLDVSPRPGKSKQKLTRVFVAVAGFDVVVQFAILARFRVGNYCRLGSLLSLLFPQQS